jgi:hypothetical protein
MNVRSIDTAATQIKKGTTITQTLACRIETHPLKYGYVEIKNAEKNKTTKTPQGIQPNRTGQSRAIGSNHIGMNHGQKRPAA